MHVCLGFSAWHVCIVRYSQLEVQTSQCRGDLNQLIRDSFRVEENTPWLSIWLTQNLASWEACVQSFMGELCRFFLV